MLPQAAIGTLACPAGSSGSHHSGCSNSRVPRFEVLGSPRKDLQPPENMVALSALAPLYGIAFSLYNIASPGTIFSWPHSGSMPCALGCLLDDVQLSPVGCTPP